MKKSESFILYMCLALATCAGIVSLTGCSKSEDTQTNAPTTEQITPVQQPPTVPADANMAQEFLNMKLKVKMSAIYNNGDASKEQKVIIELYVDSEGEGEGLLGFGDVVQPITVSENHIYLTNRPNQVICISDINARGYFNDITFSTISDMTGVGFGFTQDIPTSFTGTSDTLLLKSQYATHMTDYTTRGNSNAEQLTLEETVADIKAYQQELNPEPSEVPTPSETAKVETFYVDSDYGVTIDGVRYSLGDTCNPDDYFSELTPEGFLYSDEYKEDTKLTLTHVSYISESGRTSFSLLDNYVQAIQTNGDFDFRGFKQGMTAAEVKYGLAYKLSKKETEVYKPLDENIVVDRFKSNTYYCHVDEITIEFRLNRSMLTEIYVTKPLGFK